MHEIPFDRQGETKAYLYSNTHTYIYDVTVGDNYYLALRISIDAASGIYYTSIMTYWGNQTIRVKDNSTYFLSVTLYKKIKEVVK